MTHAALPDAGGEEPFGRGAERQDI